MADVSMKKVNRMKVTELREKLELNNLSTEGNKRELQARLKEFLKESQEDLDSDSSDLESESSDEEDNMEDAEMAGNLKEVLSEVRLASTGLNEIKTILSTLINLIKDQAKEIAIIKEENSKLLDAVKPNTEQSENQQQQQRLQEDQSNLPPARLEDPSYHSHDAYTMHNRSPSFMQDRSTPNLERRTQTKPVVLIGDSMIKHIEPKKLSRKPVNKHTYPGKTPV